MKNHTLDASKSEIIRRYQSGESLTSIATSFGVSHPEAIKIRLVRWGIEVRSRSAASQVKNSAIQGRNKRKLEGWRNLNFRVDAELHQSVKARAKLRGLSLSQVVLDSLCDYLGVSRVDGVARVKSEGREYVSDGGLKQLNVFVPVELYKLIKLRADREGVSLNRLGVAAISQK